MGQYYKPAILGENKKTVIKWMYSHDYGNGLKLMEHSYIGNGFVSAFESLILNKPQRVVWAGDYAEPCKRRKTNVYKRCLDGNNVVTIDPPTLEQTRYIINHSKKLYVDKNNYKAIDADDWQIHPLPLLTSEGNGQGGGDYYSKNDANLIGTWARDVISVSDKAPEDYNELKTNFAE